MIASTSSGQSRLDKSKSSLMTDDANEQPRGELTVRLVAMPRDTNANGDIFGGWVLSQMDQAGGIAAVEAAHGRVATVAIDAMHFIRPVKVGDVLCVYTAVDLIGRTSLKVHIEAWARRSRTRHRVPRGAQGGTRRVLVAARP